MRPGHSIIMLLAAILFGTASASAAELVMYRRAGCAWCAAWDREVGPIYGKTEFGQRAPIRFNELRRDGERVSLKMPIRYSPSFVLVEDGREIGRIEGYTGEDFFWGLLEKLMRRLPAERKVP